MSTPEFFIYWRCRALDAEAAQAAARAMQARLCQQWHGLQARLLLRVDRADQAARAAGELTVMETYHFVHGQTEHGQTAAVRHATDDAGHHATVAAALHDSLRSAGAVLQPWLCGARHIEVFEPLP